MPQLPSIKPITITIPIYSQPSVCSAVLKKVEEVFQDHSRLDRLTLIMHHGLLSDDKEAELDSIIQQQSPKLFKAGKILRSLAPDGWSPHFEHEGTIKVFAGGQPPTW